MPVSGGHPRLPSVQQGAVHPGEIVRPFRQRSTRGATMAVSRSGTVRQVRPPPGSQALPPSGGRSATAASLVG
jgi:hypothetical protein